MIGMSINEDPKLDKEGEEYYYYYPVSVSVASANKYDSLKVPNRLR